MHFLPRMTKRRWTIATFLLVLTYTCVHAAHRVYYGYESPVSALLDSSLLILVYFANLGLCIMVSKSSEIFDRRRAAAIKAVDDANDQFLGLQERLYAHGMRIRRGIKEKYDEANKELRKKYGLDAGEEWKE